MAISSSDEILSVAKQLSLEEQTRLVGELSQAAGRKNGGLRNIRINAKTQSC